MRFEHGDLKPGDIIDARPLSDDWFVLRKDGPFDLHGLSGMLDLHLSNDGSLAAVVERGGRLGRVFGLAEGRTTMALDRGDDHPETSVFPVAFAAHHGRTVWCMAPTGTDSTCRTRRPAKP